MDSLNDPETEPGLDVGEPDCTGVPSRWMADCRGDEPKEGLLSGYDI